MSYTFRFLSVGLVLSSYFFPSVAFAEPRLPADSVARAEVLRLIQNPKEIESTLKSTRSRPDVREYFNAIYEDPEFFKKEFVSNTKLPVEFREDLLERIYDAFIKQKLPRPRTTSVKPIRVRYAQVVLRGFRNPEPKLRAKAFRIYKNAVLGELNGAERLAILASLHAVQRRPEARIVAAPAIFLTETADQLLDKSRFKENLNRFEQLRLVMVGGSQKQQEPDPDAVLATLHALKITGTEKRLRPDIQVELIPFFEFDDDLIQRATFALLTARHDGVTADTNLLGSGAYDSVVGLLNFDRPLPVSSRIYACKVIARDSTDLFFGKRSMASIRPTLVALSAAITPGRPDALRIAALEAMAQIQPADEDSLLALAGAMGDPRSECRAGAFRGMGGNDQRRRGGRLGEFTSVLTELLNQVEAKLASRKWDEDTTTQVDRSLFLIESNPSRDPAFVTRLIQLLPRAGNAPVKVRDRLVAAIENCRVISRVDVTTAEPPAIAELLRTAIASGALDNPVSRTTLFRILRANPATPGQVILWIRDGEADLRALVLSYLESEQVTKAELANLVRTPEFDDLAELGRDDDRLAATLVLVTYRSGVAISKKLKATLRTIPRVLALTADEFGPASRAAGYLLDKMRQTTTGAALLPLDERDFMEPIFVVATSAGGKPQQITARTILSDHTAAHTNEDSCIRELFEAAGKAEE